MSDMIDPGFGELFIASSSDFYRHSIEALFHRWWATAPQTAIDKYVEAIERNPEQAALAHEGWLAEAPDFSALARCAQGTLGHAYHAFIIGNGLREQLALDYRKLFDRLQDNGELMRVPSILRYKLLRGHQTHDLHHVIGGFPPTAFGELGLQAFQLAQMSFPYAAMWIAAVTTHMALVDPYLIGQGMDIITRGWAMGRRARNIQFVKFEEMYDRPLDEIRAEFKLLPEAAEGTGAQLEEPVADLLRAA